MNLEQLLIPLAILLPILGTLMMLGVGRYFPKSRSHFAIYTLGATFVALLALIPAVLSRGETLHLTYSWVPQLGMNFEIYVDAFSLSFAVLASFLCLLAAIYSAKYMAKKEGLTRYYATFLLFAGSMIGLFMSGNLFQFFIFWELMSISCFVLVSQFQTGASIRAAYKYFIMIHAGAICLLTAIIAIYLSVGELSMPALWGAGGLTATNPGLWLTIAMVLTFVAFAVKAAVVPLHTWLPRAHPEAPSPISALLSGIMIKAGIYGLMRFFFGVYGVSFDGTTWGLIIATLGVVTMMVAIHMALVERDIKRFLAFSSISNIGLILLGLGIGTGLGIAGGLFHLFNHAILKALLFLCAGSIIYRVGTRNVDEMGGLARRMPLTAGFFIIGALAISGIPPLNGFASKLLIYQSALGAGDPFGSIYMIYCFLAIYVSAVTLVAFLRIVHGAFFDQMPERFRRVKEAPKSMTIPMGILAVACIVIGILPQIPLNHVVIPGMRAVGGIAAQGLSTSWLGFATPLGGYQALTLVLLIGPALGIGALVYFTKVRKAPGVQIPDKYKVMTGGEEAPYLTHEEIHTSSAAYSDTIKKTLGPLFRAAERGGFDLIWNGIAGGVRRGCNNFHRRLITAGFVPVLLFTITLGVLISLFLLGGII